MPSRSYVPGITKLISKFAARSRLGRNALWLELQDYWLVVFAALKETISYELLVAGLLPNPLAVIALPDSEHLEGWQIETAPTQPGRPRKRRR